MRLLILDRDGVINHDSDAFIKSIDEWIPIDGSLNAIAAANQMGYRVVVVSNQSGLARGLLNLHDLNQINALMCQEVTRLGGHIDAVFFCPHGPDDNCTCRKPRAGLLHSISARLGETCARAILVGDRASDMAAAAAVGATRYLVKTGHGRKTLETLDDLADIRVFDDLAAVVAHLREQH